MIREISEKCGIHRQTIARNLDVMELVGLVRKIEIGNAKKYYQINTLPISGLIDIASDLIIIINSNHVIEYINKSAKELLGLESHLVGEKLESLNLDIFSSQKVLDGLKRVTSDKVYRFETAYERNNGCSWYSLSILNLSFKPGNLSIALVAEDITEKIKSKISLEDANRYHRGLIEASIDPFIIISPEGKITDVNIATMNITGCSREDLIGSNFTEYFTDPRKARQGYLSVFETGQVRHYPLEIIHKDGYVTPVRYNASLYFDENRNIKGIFVVARDITKIKKAEEELILFKSIIERTNEAVAVRDPEGKLLYINKSYEKLFGRNYEETRLIGYKDYYPPESIEILNNQVEPLLRQGGSWEGELEAFDANGRKFTLWKRADAIFDKNGTMLYAFELMHANSERKNRLLSLIPENKKVQ